MAHLQGAPMPPGPPPPPAGMPMQLSGAPPPPPPPMGGDNIHPSRMADGHHAPPPQASSPGRDRSDKGSTPASRTLWLGNITTVHTEDALWTYFERFGTLDCIRVLYAKSIAFINFMNEEPCLRAREHVSKHPVCGAMLEHNFGQPKPAPAQPTGKCSLGEHEYPSNIVWIGGLQPPINEESLRTMFAGYEGLDRVAAYDQRGIAFLNFKTIHDATVVRAALIGKPLAGVPVKICYGKASETGPGLAAGTMYTINPLRGPVDYYSNVDESPPASAAREL
eukprot:TRINITY_DN10695_c0_g1_i2.p1 TRINITY_DN10695_c0_g1~~TRINITY_DN10695_c0_g1_i2.p1  ORF type:complete len:294 (+),score=103.23 TRINITY_DN10695_c0_g1_i2:46-882(+)